MYPYRRGDQAYPNRGNDNTSAELVEAVLDTLRYRPPDGEAWTAHSVACWIRDHAILNGIRPDSFDGWDIERIIEGLVAEGRAEYAPEGGE